MNFSFTACLQFLFISTYNKQNKLSSSILMYCIICTLQILTSKLNSGTSYAEDLSHFSSLFQGENQVVAFRLVLILMHKFLIFNCTVVRKVSSAADSEAVAKKRPLCDRARVSYSISPKTSHQKASTAILIQIRF